MTVIVDTNRLRDRAPVRDAVRWALLMGMPFAALAAEGDAERTSTLSTITVEETLDPARTEDTGSYTTEASTTAFKMPLSLRETPQTVTVVSAQAMQDFNLETARDILNFVPGLSVQSERNTEAYYVEARGYELQVQYDGIPNPVGVGGRGYGDTDAAFLDRVEVLHGASGLLSGVGNPGGTINLVRKTPGTEFASSLEGGADSFGGYRFVGDVGGSITDQGLGGRLVAVHEERDLYMRDSSGKNTGFYGVLEAALTDASRVWIGGEYMREHDANYGAHYGFPTQPDGTLYDWSKDRKLNLGADWSWQKQDRYTLFARGEHVFGNDWRVAGMYTLDRTDFRALEANPGSEGEPVIFLSTQREKWGNRTHSLDVFAEGPFTLFNREHRLVVGANGSDRQQLNGDYEYTEEPLIEITDPANWRTSMAPDPDTVEFFSTNWGSGRDEQIGAYAAGRFEVVDSLHAILGARATWYKSSWDGVTGSKSDGTITPYAGVVWDFSPTMSLYGSYSEIFKPQDIGTIDINGDILPAVTGEQIEAGLKLELLEGRFNASAAVFQLDQTNLAEVDLTGEVPGRCGPTAPLDPCSRPAGLVRNEGIELAAAGDIGGGWKITAGYALFTQDRDKTTDDGGLGWNPKDPKHKLNVALSWTSPDERWNAGASFRAQSKSYVEGALDWDLDGDGTWSDTIAYRIQQDAFQVVGLFGRFKVTDNVSVSAAVDNLFDEAYLSGISYPVHGQVWGDARKYSLTVRTTF